MLKGSNLISRLSISFKVSVSSVNSSKSMLHAELNGFLKLIKADVVSFSLQEIQVTAMSFGIIPVPDTIQLNSPTQSFQNLTKHSCLTFSSDGNYITCAIAVLKGWIVISGSLTLKLISFVSLCRIVIGSCSGLVSTISFVPNLPNSTGMSSSLLVSSLFDLRTSLYHNSPMASLKNLKVPLRSNGQSGENYNLYSLVAFGSSMN